MTQKSAGDLSSVLTVGGINLYRLFLPHILIKKGFLENVLEHTKFIGS